MSFKSESFILSFRSSTLQFNIKTAFSMTDDGYVYRAKTILTVYDFYVHALIDTTFIHLSFDTSMPLIYIILLVF